MPFTIVTQGSFTSAGVGVRIPLPSSADYFVTKNLTQLATTQATGRGVMFEWYGNGLVALDNAIEWKKTNSTDALNMVLVTSGGFTYVTTNPVVEAQAANAITAITAANPAVVTQTNNYSEDDILRFYSTTGMLQIGGMAFQISSVSGSGYTLLGLPATASNGFASPGTAGFTRRISKYEAVDPQYLYITNISQAAQAVVSTSVDPSNYYVVGNRIHFSIPSSFGMTQMDQLTGTILAINDVSAASDIGAYNITVDIDSSAFTAFAFPASTSSPTAQLFATLAPAGSRTTFNPVTLVQTGYEFQKTPFHTGQFTPYMFLAAGAQSPAGSIDDVIVWQAYKMET
jgi:hypothetical protein